MRAEFAARLKAYRIAAVTGDRNGGKWPRERFREHGIAREAAENTESEIYAELVPLLNSGQVELLDPRD